MKVSYLLLFGLSFLISVSYILPVYSDTWKECSYCYGTGWIECYNCDGNGETACPHCHGAGEETTDCSFCFGTGKVDCSWCRGTGFNSYGQLCYNCYGSGEENCPICLGNAGASFRCYRFHGSGYVGCENCGGVGEVLCWACNGEGGELVEEQSDLNPFDTDDNFLPLGIGGMMFLVMVFLFFLSSKKRT